MVQSNDPVEPKSGKSFSQTIFTILGQIPVIGKFLAPLGDASPSALAALLLTVFLLTIYPLISFGMTLLLVWISPTFVQSAVQNLILNAVGVNGRVDKSNTVIDASIPMEFTQSGSEVYDERVMAGQVIKFDAFVRRVPLHSVDPLHPLHIDPVCFNPSDLKNTDIVGTLTVYTPQSSKQLTLPVYGALGQLWPVGPPIDSGTWKLIEEDSPTPSTYYLITVSFQPNLNLLKSNAFFHCNSFEVTLTMNTFKPFLNALQ